MKNKFISTKLETRLNCLHIPSVENITKSLTYEEASKEHATTKKYILKKYYRNVSGN